MVIDETKTRTTITKEGITVKKLVVKTLSSGARVGNYRLTTMWTAEKGEYISELTPTKKEAIKQLKKLIKIL